MLGNEAQASVCESSLKPAAHANTAALAGAWVDCRQAVGDIVVIQHVGVTTATATVLGGIQTASSATGAGATGLVGNEGAFELVNSANDDPNIQMRTIDHRRCKGWMRYAGTNATATGPTIVGAVVLHRPKYAS